MNRKGVMNIILAAVILLSIVIVVASGNKVLGPLVRLSPSIQAEEIKLDIDAAIAAPGDIEIEYVVPEVADKKAIRFVTFGQSGQVCVSSLSICEMGEMVGFQSLAYLGWLALDTVLEVGGVVGHAALAIGQAITLDFDEAGEELGKLVDCAADAVGLGDDCEATDAEEAADEKKQEIIEKITMILSQLYCQKAVLDSSTDVEVKNAGSWGGINWRQLQAACDLTDPGEIKAAAAAAVTAPAAGFTIAITGVSGERGEGGGPEENSVFINDPSGLKITKRGNDIEIKER
jgi:hypothetical protein